MQQPTFRFNSQHAYEPDEFFIHQPSTVDFVRSRGQVSVVIDDTWSVPLERRDQTAGQVNLGMDHADLKERFLTGRYFIVDDQVIDWRGGDDLKFMHDDAAIAKLASTIGFVDSPTGCRAGNVTHKLDYEAFQSEGGQFDVHIGFNWSPFSLDINSQLSLLRLVCSNGLVAQSPIMHHRIPMMNAWEDNLAISNDVIGHSFHKLVGPRLAALTEERISVHDALMMRSFLNDLSTSKQATGAQLLALNNMLELIEPVFTDEVMSLSKNMLKFVHAPITGFDALNVATECATHYVGEDRSKVKAELFANSLIFSEDRQRNIRTDLDKLMVDVHTFDNPDQAFFGQTCH